MLLSREQVGRLTPEDYELVAALEKLKADDPLAFFHACPTDCGVPGCVPHPQQHEFLVAQTKVQAVFAGNRFGKTTALVVKALIQHYPIDSLPERLRPYRFVTHDKPVKGRFMCPNDSALNGYVLPKIQEWVPRHLLLGGKWSKAFSLQRSVLHFADGGQIEFRTYMVDPSTLVGADLDYVANDEPSPEAHARENWWRLVDRKGKMIHALTPVNMVGGGIGWLYRDVYKKRDNPKITVVMGAIHDNKHLDSAEVADTLAGASDLEREAREFGRFVHLGGMVFPNGFEDVLMRREVTPADVKAWDVVIGIDPGLKNAAFVWIGFDSDNVAYIFDEEMLHEKTPADYAKTIRAINAKWGIRDPMMVIDPSARNRSLTNAESVEAVLQQQGIYCTHGYNPVEAGLQQMRLRMQKRMLWVSPACRRLRDQAEEYRMQDRPDGEFKIVKERDHLIDAARYGCATRLWDPGMDSEQDAQLGWTPSAAPSAAQFSQAFANRPTETSPLGPMA